MVKVSSFFKPKPFSHRNSIMYSFDIFNNMVIFDKLSKPFHGSEDEHKNNIS